VKIGPELDWLSDDNRVGLPMERTSAPQPSATAQPRLPRASVHVGTRVSIGRSAGGTAKPGWSPRKGRRFEFLPRRKSCRNTADQPFLLSSQNPQFRASLVLQFCALASQGDSTARKVGQIIARGNRRWLIRVYSVAITKPTKEISQSNHSVSHAGTASPPDRQIARTRLGTRSGRCSGARLENGRANPAYPA
jgi:hypothetical protein